MTSGITNTVYADLGEGSLPDPFLLQPGALLLSERFCVLGRVRHNRVGWQVAVTDLNRELGLAPHHRLELIHLPTSPTTTRRIRRALPAYHHTPPWIHGVMSTDEGLLLVVQPAESPPLAPGLPTPELQAIGHTLACVLVRLHEQGLASARFTPRGLRLDRGRRCQIVDWTHLLDLSPAPSDEACTRDVEALKHLLLELEAPRAWIEQLPQTARGLAQHLEAPPGEHPSGDQALPAIPPFVGRKGPLLEIHKQLARARHTGPSVLLITGGPGVGRSRLLDQAALELQRGDTALCIRAAYATSSPSARGLGDLMGTLALAVEGLPRPERDAIASRMLAAVGPLRGLVHLIDTRLSTLIGQGPPLPGLPLDKRFVRHAATAAALLAAVGTPERPLLLLLDDLHHADASTRALLYHLLVPGQAHHTALVITAPAHAPELPRSIARLELEPYSDDEIQALITAVLPGAPEHTPEIVELLSGASEGNPRGVWNALRSAVRTGHVVHSHTWHVARSGDAEVLQLVAPWRWEELSTDARRLAAILAVRTEPVDLSWLHRVTRWPTARIQGALSELGSSHVVIWGPDRRVQWPTEAARHRVLDSASEAAVRRAHRAVSRWLEQHAASSPPAQRAWHAEHAEAPGRDPQLAERHVEAGQARLRAYDAERALWHFERALERGEALSLRRQALEGRGDALLLLSRTEDALATYLATVDLVDEPQTALAIANKAVHGLYLEGAVQAGRELADRALRVVGQRLPQGWLEALLEVARGLLGSLRPRRPDVVADQLCLLHTTIIAGMSTNRPFLVPASLARLLEAASRRSSPAASRARAFLSVGLAEAGATERLSRLLDRAEGDAEAGNDPYALGIVHHFRGQGLLGLGSYEEGQLAFSRAIDAFQRAGDLSIGAITLALGVFYALDREPTERLLERIQQAEAAAFRQRNRSILPLLCGARLLVQARAGSLDPASVQELALEAQGAPETHDLISNVVGDALTALALEQVGRPFAAEPFARRALERIDHDRLRPAFLEIALLAAARVSVARLSEGGSLSRARRLVRRLRRRRERVRSLKIASYLVEASLHLSQGDLEATQSSLEAVISTAPAHGEIWHELEALELMARVLAVRDAHAAQLHTARAEQLRGALVTPPPPPIEAEPPAPAVARTEAQDTRLDLVVEGLPSLVERYLKDRSLRVVAHPGLRTTAPPELLELLLVNLVLAASDASTSDAELQITAETAEATDPSPLPRDAIVDGWIRIRVEAPGALGSGARGALAECSELCRRLDGFLEVGEGDSVDLSAWLQADRSNAASTRGLVAILVHDDQLQRTLIEGVLQLGWSAQALAPGEPISDEAIGILVAPELADQLPPGVASIPVVQRSRGWDRGRELPLPFLLRELQSLLSPLGEARGPSASAQLPG